MDNKQEMTVVGIMNSIDGVNLHEKRGGKFKFRIYMKPGMSELPIEVLDLSVRSYNSLKRAGYSTIGALTDAIGSGVELKYIRNCGARSVREIMERLFLFHYEALPENRRREYLDEVIRMNL